MDDLGKLRVLVTQYYYSARDLTGVSMFNWYRALYKANEDRMIMYLEVPREWWKEWGKAFVEYDIDDDELEKYRKMIGDNVRFIRLARAREMKEWETYIPTEDEHRFVRNIRSMPIDVILSGTYGYTWLPVISQLERKSAYYSEVRVPVIHFQHETWRDYISMQMLGTRQLKTIILMNMVLSDMVFVFNEPDKIAVLEEAKKLLSHSVYNDLKKKIEIVHPIYPYYEIDDKTESYIESRKERIRREKKVVFYHAGTPEKKRRLHVFADILKKLVDDGSVDAKFKMIISSAGTYEKELKKFFGHESIEMLFALPRHRLIEEMRTADIAVCLSIYYGTGLACLEASASGMLPIYWRIPDTVDRVPPKYPYRVVDEKELEEVVKQLGDPAEFLKVYDEWAHKVARHVQKNFGREEARRIFDLIVKLRKRFVDDYSEKKILLWDAFKDAVDSIPSGWKVDHERLISIVSAMTKKGKRPKEIRSLITEIGLRILAHKYGLRDIGDIDKIVWWKP